MLEGLRAKQRSLSRIVREGQEDREVACSSTLNRASMIETITRLDTGEVVTTSPITSSEAKDGARWIPNFKRKVSELIHPDEPNYVLETREIEDEERQLDLAGDDDEADMEPLRDAKPAKKKRGGAGASPL